MSEISGQIGGGRDPESKGGIEPEPLTLDAAGGRWLRRHLAGGVAALTTTVDGSFRASTITACMSVSLEPLQFLVSLELDSQMEGWLLASELFAINMLPWDQQFLADQFAGFTPRASPRFAGIQHFFAATGAPILARSIAWADCRLVSSIETGDHRCFIGQAVALGKGAGDEGNPMIYYLNRYRRMQ